MSEQTAKIIILEKDRDRKWRLKTVLCEEGYTVFSFDSILNCVDNIDQLDADLILLGADNVALSISCIDALMAIGCRLPLLVLSNDRLVRRYLKTNYWEDATVIDESYTLDTFKHAVRSALKIGKRAGQSCVTSFLVGRSSEITNTKRQLPGLARLHESILIIGEEGTGKEAVARAIHGFSGREIDHFIRIDASELKDDNTSSLLRVFEKCNVGPGGSGPEVESRPYQKWTIYMDEVGRLPRHLQGELLLVSGSQEDNFRILAGTSQDLTALVEAGRFRKDLYYRLNVLNLHLPPLRHRREDIPLLTDFFTYKFCREFDMVCVLISSGFKEKLRQYHWPGNVRELREIVRRTVLTGERESHISTLPPRGVSEASRLNRRWRRELSSIERLTAGKEYLGQVGEIALKNICCDVMAQIEKRVMRAALENTNWNRKKAAAMLDISYKSMLNKIKAYELA